MRPASTRLVSEKVDAVVVGAGPAGAVTAAVLAESGRSVVVLEAGPAWNQGHLVSSQIWARRLHGSALPVESVGAEPYGYGFNGGWGVGGAALHHYALWPRLHEEDFEVKSRFGRGLDWPLRYDDLRPFYDRIQKEVGISGDAEREIWRPPGDPYPMPPLRTFAQARILARGFAARGMCTAPAPLAINSIDYNGRPACIYDGWCDAGCPINALANPLVNFLPRATRAGASLRARTRVARILSAAKRRVDGVEYVTEKDVFRTLYADVVILAASAVHNPALLLGSSSRDHPAGLGNENGMVGRYFMTHSGLNVFALFDEDTEPEMGVPGGQLISHDSYPKARRKDMLGSLQWVIAPSTKPNDLQGMAMMFPRLHGRDLQVHMRRAVRSAARLVAHGEELPRIENRIELSGVRHIDGSQSVRIIHEFDVDAKAVWNHAKTEGAAIMHAAGARQVGTSTMGTAHMMGGTIMGNDPRASVTDAFGRIHSMDNLYVAGSGLFPTGGAVNPTFSICALSLRNAEHLVEHWPV